MDFEKKVPEWSAEGSEPSESLKKNGFQGGYKPPAGIFNWFWHGVSACLNEIREKLSNVDNTADADKSVKYAGESGTAGKVKNSLLIHLNGGTTEDEDLITYDASTSKAVNITPGLIGAAAQSHKHIASDINGVLTVEHGGTGSTSSPSMKVNLSSVAADSVYKASPRPGVEGILAVSNGGTGASDASTARSNLGAAAASHTHSASDISSGTLPVERGGTGNTSVDTTPTSGSTKMVTSGGVYTALSEKAASSHTHAASSITAGTFAGRVQGNATAMATLSNTQFRSIYAGTADLTAGTSSLATGTLYFVYE